MAEGTASKIAGFNYKELTTSFHGSIGQDTASIIKEYLIEWADLPAFIGALRGGWTLSNPTTYSFNRADRLTGVFSNFYCLNVEFDSYGKSWIGTRPSNDNTEGVVISATGESAWDKAHVFATYQVPKQDFSGDPNNIMEETLEYDVDVLILPEGAFKKKGGTNDDVINLPTKIVIPCITWVIKLINRPSLPLSGSSIFGAAQIGGSGGLAEKAGAVNSVDFRGASKGKVMFNGCKAERSFIAADIPLGYTITLPFKYRAIPWTYLYSPSEGKFVEVEPAKAGGAKLVDVEFDFNTLLAVQQPFTINDPTPGTPGS